GDFVLDGRRLVEGEGPKLTYAGIGVFRPELFAGLEAGRPAKLAPLLYGAIGAGRASGELHTGRWTDVGTPQRLADLDTLIRTLS
ncbi:MAG: mannose-1-phosphate guanylyltransferase, partial [Rhodocyclaceae bacterium]|nr:mannose-1-phosphate guanylyltransferase [Rhodocyclaceae bacterium]